MTKVIIHPIPHPVPDPSLDYGDTVKDNNLTHVSGKVMGQEEEIKAQVYPSTNDTCKLVYELIQTKGLVNRVTCKLREFPHIWKQAKLRTQ